MTGKTAEWEARDFNKAFRIIREREERYGRVVINPTLLCLCKHRKMVTDLPLIPTTGVVKDAVSIICPGCAKDTRDLARLICVGCREMVGLIKPHTDPEGFTFRGGRFYHVANCPKCSKEKVEKSPIIERLLFYKKHGLR